MTPAALSGRCSSGPGDRQTRSDLAGAAAPRATEVLRRHEGLAAGAGVVLAPGVLADAPRAIEWWWEDRGGAGPRAASRSTSTRDPPSSTTTRPRSGTASRGAPVEPAVAGPYVDYICTHEYTFTIAVPIVSVAVGFAGVAGADILAAQVEQLALPGLSGLGRTAVLVSGTGRVIASNTAGVLPGVPAQRQPGCAELVPAARPRPPARPPALDPPHRAGLAPAARPARR